MTKARLSCCGYLFRLKTTHSLLQVMLQSWALFSVHLLLSMFLGGPSQSRPTPQFCSILVRITWLRCNVANDFMSRRTRQPYGIGSAVSVSRGNGHHAVV